MRLLALLVLAQVPLNLNVTPIESRQDGARLSTRRQYVIDCRANMTCTIDGGSLYLSSSGGGSSGGYDGGKVGEAYAADASITAVTAGAAYSADAAGFANYLPLTCGAGDFVTCAGTSCSCATPAGGGGSGLSYAEVSWQSLGGF